ncbi:hypothetical protein Pr1d_45410 [Bythopirellula goksoeyrii]|uniref:Uncharacterized protein n=1 Tax=Bythopirellula goksoeyrii TaxID=1400387 RepID=A0A5B9QHY9_9BACT|nr:hypothetical protein Pr1d_45410 [Bythopirellula goksoeyrii]
MFVKIYSIFSPGSEPDICLVFRWFGVRHEDNTAHAAYAKAE